MRILVWLLAALPCAGQLADNTLTVQASRTVYLQPDQVEFGIYVISGMGATLDDIVASLDGSGITADNFATVSRGSSAQFVHWYDQSLEWIFTRAVPISQMKDTIASLKAFQNNTAVQFTFDVDALQVSKELQSSQPCSATDLVADAKAQAQKLAAAAGRNVGAVLAVSDGSTSGILSGAHAYL